jgi:8-oxo-dGTP pyrophosphatase MutT (NUDIX family)
MTDEKPKRAARPRDAASLVLVRRNGAGIEVLMGQRNKQHRFMPESYVFPGGRVDAKDGRLDFGVPLKPYVLTKLSKSCTASRAMALALAAIRETYEETGLMVGTPLPAAPPRHCPPAWHPFINSGLAPAVDALHYIARATTPPFRPIRFHARFFMVDGSLATGELGGSGELEYLRWLPVAEALTLPVPSITERVLKEVDRLMANAHELDDPERPVTAYRTLHRKHQYFHD